MMYVAAKPAKSAAGWVAALWHYPVKFMLVEQLEEADFAERGSFWGPGLLCADLESGWIQTAKRSGWEGFFGFRANLTGEPYGDPSRLRITLPDGEIITGEAEDRDEKPPGPSEVA